MSNPEDLSSKQEIVELVKLLRQNGDKVLNASSKLCLSTMLLHNLNDAFSLIMDEPEDLESSFQVCNSSKIDIFRDIKFLHDFVQKTVGLKVVHCGDNPNVQVDITKFRHLKYLELKKVCIQFVKGLQGVRGQLESVVCAGRRGITAVEQLLAQCGGDKGFGFVWGALRHLSLSHNALEKLDVSLELAPWLQIIDLSHNLITTANELSCLPNLKYVNLGYNRLERVPTFNKAAVPHLQVLVLKNNYLEDITELQHLECLNELDLSFNCLTEHSRLWPLEKMSALLWISLLGNPLSYHPKHRMQSIKHLHPCLSNSKFVLDQLPLSRLERQIVAENQIFTITSKELCTSLSSSLNSTVLSTSITSSTEAIARREPIEIIDTVDRHLSKNRKKASVKEAVITEDEHEKKEELAESSSLSSSYLETSKDHLETKKQILAVRKQFGEDNWLSSHAGTCVQDIMGLQPTSFLALASTPITDGISDMMNIHSVDNKQDKDEESVEHCINDDGVSSKDDEKSGISNDDEKVNDTKLLDETVETPVNIPGPVYDPEEETGDLYIVHKKKNETEMEELFLIITQEDIKERDAVTGKVKYSWSTSSVLSCVLGRSEPITVDIIFDTTRKDRENRRYFAETDDAKKIVTTISERMKKRPILLKVFKCMKCSTHFSQDTEYIAVSSTSLSGNKQLKCPTCESTLVIQTDELSTFDGETEINESPTGTLTKDQCLDFSAKPNLKHSESFSSIGGKEGGAISITTSLVHSDSHTQAQVCCSATSLEESRESTPSANALNKKYESDIEILSNPSQSSIEVLDEASRNHLTPHRKRSSEERRTAIAPSLLTIPDATPIMTGLTESSSSGSLTDSICTAYENKIIKQTNPDEKETKFAPVTNLTSMIGGLLQSIKIGNNKSLMLKNEEMSNFLGSDIEYSYTDFGSVDHRLKLHIILNIFEHENEGLVLLLRADILLHSTKVSFPGCLVLSTSKVYVLRIDGHEGEDPQRWLHKEVSWTMDRLRSFAPLPFKQGVLIEMQQPNKVNEEYSTVTFLCILQDFQRTSNFLFYITELQLPPSCEVEFSVPDHCSNLMHNLLKNNQNYQQGDTVRLLAVFSSATLKYQEHSTELKLSSLIVAASVLVILEDNMQWLLPGSTEIPVIAKEQTMSNLIAIEHDSASLTLNFLDEVAGLEETWVLNFISTSAAEAVINSVQPPWEELFSVPLQITTSKVQQNQGDM